MKNQMKQVLMIVAILALGAAPALAQGEVLTEARPRPERGMGYKFGRGAVNVLTCWTEIPRNVAIEWQRTDPASGFFLGVGKGIGYGYARFMGGVFDMVTFPFPVPMGFAPVMDPEFPVENPNVAAPTGRIMVHPIHMDEMDASEMAGHDHGHGHSGAETADLRDYSATAPTRWP